MGTATMLNTKPPMEKEKKPNLFKLVRTLFQKKTQKPEEKHEEKPTQQPKTLKVTPVATLLEEFQKINIKDEDDQNDEHKNELNKFSYRERKDSEDDKEYEKIEPRNDRFGSHSSQDSGYSEQDENAKENQDEKDQDVVKKMKELKIGKKKLQTVFLPRAPMKTTREVPVMHPYSRDVEKYKEVVNTNTFSGGQVFVKPNTEIAEISRAISTIETNVQNFPLNNDQQDFLLETGLDFVTQETSPRKESELPEEIHFCIDELNMLNDTLAFREYTDISNTILNFDLENYQMTNQEPQAHTFPTPPYSENALSPLSLNLGSPPVTSPAYSSSPGRSPNYSDLERYQEISEAYQELPNFEGIEKPVLEKKKSNPTSIMSMKQYKDLQKELSAGFSKFECCVMSRKACKEIFEEHAKKLKVEERKGLCVKLARLDTQTAYGVLQQVLPSLSADGKQEDLQCVVFSLLCERVLALRPELFLGDFGLGLLKSAALRCPGRPLFTRYLVQCVRTALRLNPSYMEGRESVFHETDALGDTLVTACARAGDKYADVLNEIVCDAPPLFRQGHANTEGYTALHVACKLHSKENPHLRTVHVLLEHGKADLWAGDVKGGDTALHLAVNSSTCELHLIMTLFRHVERAKWKQLAHVPNRSSVTPIEYARSQSKSISRPYPPEVLDFLKKCR
ncbi:uncharacterized protein LOC125239409 [Leguminivora glycinivorella]|uniref:uncharacterized protein LOC125239409 n=1 Tax=Leguminivora glycinivorella TaxID=1035111 RepID=UPI00200E8D25|nr:uncharacterized protein LOC125239409 [Leguminivora glycinivorella]